MMETIFNALKIVGLVLMVLNIQVTLHVVSSIGTTIGEKMGLNGKDVFFPGAASVFAFVATFMAMEPTIISALSVLFWTVVWSAGTALGIKLLEDWLNRHDIL